MILGGFLAAAAALLARTSGFGFGLVATPALLLSGFSLAFVVTVNLLITLATRVSVAWRLRHAVRWQQAALLVGSAIPGLWVGSRTLGAIDEQKLKLVVGVTVALAAAALAWAERRPPRRRVPGLSRRRLRRGSARNDDFADRRPARTPARAAPTGHGDVLRRPVDYFVATAAVGLAVLAAEGNSTKALHEHFVWWLPGILVANAIGTSAGLRAPASVVRGLTLGSRS
ncbi:MAG: sulfite exporter TauE/SafE family protein [Gaiellaceae bacterium MAG52_C11]|nr:sulfite exporter TauE/SafE family protein [Candidatus Gaiellasilicea maunaloa]